MILVFGKTGQVASELQRLCPGAVFLGREDADLTAPGACAAQIQMRRPDVVINAAAYTSVDKAETDAATAERVNAAAPIAMANICAALGIPFVHISTDYVFAGTGTAPWAVAAPTGPLGAYGRTKLSGEAGICQSGATYAILRTSWVFSAHGANFVKTMLRLSQTRDTVSVVADQIGGPTSANAIAKACLDIAAQIAAQPEKAGIHHFSGTPDVSWADFAREIFQQAKRNVTVTNITTQEYPTPAARPLNSRLDCDVTQKVFAIARPDWRVDLAPILKELDISHEQS